MMMTVADLVAPWEAAPCGIRKFLPTVNMTFDFVAPAQVGDWVEAGLNLCAPPALYSSPIFT